MEHLADRKLTFDIHEQQESFRWNLLICNLDHTHSHTTTRKRFNLKQMDNRRGDKGR